MPIPREVRELLGDILTPPDLEKWWNTPHEMLESRSPAEVWVDGPAGQEKIRGFIEAGKCGDMA